MCVGVTHVLTHDLRLVRQRRTVRAMRRAAGVLAVMALLSGCSVAASSGSASQTGQHDPAASPQFPPRTLAQLSADASLAGSYETVQSEGIGVQGCMGQRVVIIVPKHAGGRTVTAAMAQAYTRAGMEGSVNSVVFAVHKRSEVNDFFTAGRLIVDSKCTGYARRRVEVDVGSSLDHSQTVITR